MEIIKHKDINLTLPELFDIAAGRRKIPAGLSIDRGADFVVFSPADCTNLLGQYGPGTDYEIMFFDISKSNSIE